MPPASGANTAQTYMVQVSTATTEEVHLFGTDRSGANWCYIHPMSTSFPWTIEFTATPDDDIVNFNYGIYDLRAWDEIISPITITVHGDTGDDTITLPNNNVGHAFTVNGDAGDDVVQGSPLADVINGDAGNDDLYGEGGQDDIRGGSGQDLIEGGDGGDRLDGGPNLDTIRGGDGSDIMCGGDTFFANDLEGGDGYDYIWGSDSSGTPGISVIDGMAPVSGDECGGISGTPTNCNGPSLTAPPAFCL